MFSNSVKKSPSPPAKVKKVGSPHFQDTLPSPGGKSHGSPGKSGGASPQRKEVMPVDGKFVPEPTVGETERLLPTVTLMKHSTTLVRNGKHDPNFQKRAHDPGITNQEIPQESTQLLMLDLRISEKNKKKHRVLVISSPMQNCLQTAVIVAQELGVREIQVHHSLSEAVYTCLNLGWDFAYEPLAMRRSEMERCVRLASEEGEETRNKAPVGISAVLGKPLGTADVQENDVKYRQRVGEVLDEAASSLEFDGDHVVIIGHSSTLGIMSQHWRDKCDVAADQDCGFLTLSTPSSHSCWFSGRSRVALVPPRSLDLSKKIGCQ